MWLGLNHYEKNNYSSAIFYLERVVGMYPKSIGRFHVILSNMYLKNKELAMAKYHAEKALLINPDHQAPEMLLKEINNICN